MLISYLLLSLALFLFCFFKRWHLFCWLSYSVFLVCFLAIIPLPGEDKVKYTAPTQVVFRFDEHRFIQLTGYGCQGRMYYVDDQKQIYYELARHSAKVLTEPFAHMPEDYIFVPLSDYSAIDFSQDGGRSFGTIDIETYEGMGSYQPTYHTVENIVVMNNQLKEVQLFGRYWEIYYKPAYIERITGARNIKLEPYQGWDKIRCEIGAEK